MMSKLSRQIAETLILLRWPLLILGVVLAAISFLPSTRLDFDHSIENMFAADDPLLPPYRRLKETFGGNEIVMAVYTDPGLLAADGSGIARLAEISQSLEAIQGVSGVLSLDRPLEAKFIVQDHDVALRTRNLFEGYTHGADGKTVAVVCMLAAEDQSKISRSETIEQMRRTMRDLPHGLEDGMIAGEPVMVVDGFDTIKRDGFWLGIWSSALLGLVILLCFRSLRWVLIPLAVVQVALLMTKALLVVSGLRLSMVSSMLTAIVTVVGVATVTHVIVRFREARTDGLDRKAALTRAATLLAAPVFWACTTDAVGFLSLLAAKVGPVRDFGVMMATGSLLVLVGVVLVVPGLALLGSFDIDPRRVWGEGFIDRGLHALIGMVQRRPLLIGLGVVSLAALLTAGLFRTEVETDFTKNFRQGSPIVRSYQYVETHLGGAGVLDVVLPAPKKLDWKYLKLTQQLQQRLRDEVVVENDQGTSEPGLTKVLSLSDAVIAGSLLDLNKMWPSFRRPVINTALSLMRSRLPVFSAALHAENPEIPGAYSYRIMLRARERQPAEAKRRIIVQVEQIVRDELTNKRQKQWLVYQEPLSQRQQDDLISQPVTGFYVLLTNLIESMVRDQWVTFGLATAGIGVMMMVAFRSPVLGLVALAPNVLPILMVLGTMGHLGMKINMGAAMIAAVSMGLSVDSSIHYIFSFRRALSAGKSVRRALVEVQQSVGRAVLFSTLALIVGFSVLCTSQFVPTIYFGVLVSVAMAGGLMGNLVVLPLLLRLVCRDSRDEISA